MPNYKSRAIAALLPLIAALLLVAGPARRATAQDARPASASPAPLVKGVPREECFPLERLPADLRPKAEALLLKLLDSEALYTVVGGMKPMSSGFESFSILTGAPDLSRVKEARVILNTFRCGDEVTAGILPFHSLDNGKRYFDAVVFRRAAVGRMIVQYPDFFGPFGVTEGTPGMDIALIVEHDQTTARNRGLGYLYGYPKHAVDFFVASADEQNKTKKFVPRDFLNIATFDSPTNRFVYAVPKGYKPAPEDIALREKAEKILAAYKERRAKYVGPGKSGPAALLRDWFDDGSGRCDPDNARF